MVGLDGLEPSTSSLSGMRSNRLSYRPLSGGTPARRGTPPRKITASGREPGSVTLPEGNFDPAAEVGDEVVDHGAHRGERGDQDGVNRADEPREAADPGRREPFGEADPGRARTGGHALQRPLDRGEDTESV